MLELLGDEDDDKDERIDSMLLNSILTLCKKKMT